MSAADHLGVYAEGWTNGDADKIIGSVSDGFVLDDPNEGKIGKAGIADHLAGMKEAVASMRGENYSGPMMELTEVTTHEDDGVQSEKLAYYTKLPERPHVATAAELLAR